MTTATATRLLTAEEFALTTDPPGLKTELVRGRIVFMPPPATVHGQYVLRIGGPILAFTDKHSLGVAVAEAGFTLGRNPDTVRGPDVSFIARDRGAGNLPERGYLEGAPTLAVEVISPSETRAEVADKVAQYLAAGAERVWEVRSRQRTVTVHRNGAPPVTRRAEDALTSDDAGFAVDGFALPVAAIFA